MIRQLARLQRRQRSNLLHRAPTPATAWRLASLSFLTKRSTVKATPQGPLPTNRAHPRRVFDPEKILPVEPGQVRVCNNTTRDAQQSNLSAEMADVHRQHIGTMINDVYAGMPEPRGYEQIWGGTVPMFDVWKRGVDPFAELRQMTSHMPDTPGSALIRSNGLNAMANQPRDVVHEFIELAGRAGVCVFTNFCAHNDWRNHINVAEAVRRHGYHYQAALSWAVYDADPSMYNVRWAVEFFREVAALGAHSLYVKDPSGVLTPEMAGVLAAEVKAAFPHLPLVFHTHYQTGYGYMSYLEAIKNGANAVECSLGFHDGAGQPYGLTMVRTLEDLGFDIGSPCKDAMQRIADYCKSLDGQYAQDKIRRPCMSVEKSGIAGGQRSILDKELQDAGQPHLIPAVDVEVQTVRAQGGALCQVTPVADSYAREAMRRLRGGPDFAPGYAQILTGEGGATKEPVDAEQQKQALWARAVRTLGQLTRADEDAASPDRLPSSVASLLTEGGPDKSWLGALRCGLDLRVAGIVRDRRVVELEARIKQLQSLSEDQSLLASLERKLARAQPVDKSTGQVVATVADKISSLERELDATRNRPVDSVAMNEADYESLLLGTADASTFNALRADVKQRAQKESGVSAEVCSTIDSALSQAPEAWTRLVQGSALVTVVLADMLPPGLPAARRALEQTNKEHNLGLDFAADPESEAGRKVREWTLLQASYAGAAIPGLITNFFCHVGDPKHPHWPTLFTEPPPPPPEPEEEPEEVVLHRERFEKNPPDNFFAHDVIHEVNAEVMERNGFHRK